MVERDLPKVDVASSNLVIRSTFVSRCAPSATLCPPSMSRVRVSSSAPRLPPRQVPAPNGRPTLMSRSPECRSRTAHRPAPACRRTSGGPPTFPARGMSLTHRSAARAPRPHPPDGAGVRLATSGAREDSEASVCLGSKVFPHACTSPPDPPQGRPPHRRRGRLAPALAPPRDHRGRGPRAHPRRRPAPARRRTGRPRRDRPDRRDDPCPRRRRPRRSHARDAGRDRPRARRGCGPRPRGGAYGARAGVGAVRHLRGPALLPRLRLDQPVGGGPRGTAGDPPDGSAPPSAPATWTPTGCWPAPSRVRRPHAPRRSAPS